MHRCIGRPSESADVCLVSAHRASAQKITIPRWEKPMFSRATRNVGRTTWPALQIEEDQKDVSALLQRSTQPTYCLLNKLNEQRRARDEYTHARTHAETEVGDEIWLLQVCPLQMWWQGAQKRPQRSLFDSIATPVVFAFQCGSAGSAAREPSPEGQLLLQQMTSQQRCTRVNNLCKCTRINMLWYGRSARFH